MHFDTLAAVPLVDAAIITLRMAAGSEVISNSESATFRRALASRLLDTWTAAQGDPRELLLEATTRAINALHQTGATDVSTGREGLRVFQDRSTTPATWTHQATTPAGRLAGRSLSVLATTSQDVTNPSAKQQALISGKQTWFALLEGQTPQDIVTGSAYLVAISASLLGPIV